MSSFLSPVTYFWILIVCSFIIFKLKRKKAGKAFAVTAFVLLFLATISPLPILMVRTLERQYAVYNSPAPAKRLPILVLGAGHINDPALPPLQRLSIPLLDRVAEGVRLYNLSGGSKIIFSGFSKANNSPHATAMAGAALELGVKPQDTLMLLTPTDTWKEAQAFKKRFGTTREFILVTSAVHMPRAMMLFSKLGMKPIAAPANFLSRNEPGANPYHWWPSTMKPIFAEAAIYEFFSTQYYRIAK